MMNHRTWQCVAVLVLVVGFAVAGAARDKDDKGKSSSSYPVDRGQVLAAPLSGAKLVIKQFSTENADFGTAKKKAKKKAQDVAEQMEATAPPALAQSIVNHLEDENVFESVSLYRDGEDLEDAMVLEGEFTVLNPGSRGKRYWVGMGAGRSRICVNGHVAGPGCETLLTFDHCRSGAMGWFGGRAEGMMFTDVAGTAEKITAFLEGWGAGRHEP